MKLFRTLTAAGFIGAVAIGPALALDISGAGATFPYPIYAKWADAYKKETNIGLNYQSIGSGGGGERCDSGGNHFAVIVHQLGGGEVVLLGVGVFDVADRSLDTRRRRRRLRFPERRPRPANRRR